MENSNPDKAHIVEFLEEKGFTKNRTQNVFRRFESIEKSHVRDNWNYLKGIGIQEKKLPHIVSKCPRILTLSLDDKLMPTVHCLETLGSKPEMSLQPLPNSLAYLFTVSKRSYVDPLLGFFQAIGMRGKEACKLVLLNPRLISYSIETKFSEILYFLQDCGLDQDGIIDRILVKHPFIMGYSVERRLSPTTGFLKSIGLSEFDQKKVVMNFPQVLCKDVNKILKLNEGFLKRGGFDNGQIVVLVTEYPPMLIKGLFVWQK